MLNPVPCRFCGVPVSEDDPTAEMDIEGKVVCAVCLELPGIAAEDEAWLR